MTIYSFVLLLSVFIASCGQESVQETVVLIKEIPFDTELALAVPDDQHADQTIISNNKNWVEDRSEIMNESKFIEKLVVAEFDKTRKLNRTRYEVWTMRPSDDTQGTRLKLAALDQEEALGGPRHVLRVMYDTESDYPVANGLWLRFNDLDVRNYDYFTMRVRGDKRIGFTEHFGLGFLNGDGELYIYRIEDISEQWQTVGVRLKYGAAGHLDSLVKIYFIFNTETASSAKGILYFDAFEFAKSR